MKLFFITLYRKTRTKNPTNNGSVDCAAMKRTNGTKPGKRALSLTHQHSLNLQHTEIKVVDT
jgi:hypothetical protein